MATSVTLTAGPVSPAGVVTLTATVTAADPAGDDAVGEVTFSRDNVVLGQASVTGGTATLTMQVSGAATFAAAFAPNDPGAFARSASAPVTVTVPAGAGQETLDVTVVEHGALTLAVDQTPVSLPPPANAGADLESRGALNPVTVDDSRERTHFGWDASGSVSDFTDGPHAFGANALGWSPTIVTPNASNDVTPGPAVQANNPGLGSAAARADAAAGHGAGTTVLGAGLDLRIPFTTPAGSYHTTITVTLVSK